MIWLWHNYKVYRQAVFGLCESHRIKRIREQVLRKTLTMTHRGASRLVLFLSKCYCRHQIKEDEIGGACSTYGDKRDAHTVCMGKVKGNRPLGRPSRWLQNVKLEFKERGFDELDWINQAQNMDKCQGVLYTIMNLRVPQNVGNVFTSSWTRSVWRRPAWRHQNILTLRYIHTCIEWCIKIIQTTWFGLIFGHYQVWCANIRQCLLQLHVIWDAHVVFERRKISQVRPDRQSSKVCMMEYPTDMVRRGQFVQQDAKYQNKVITKHVTTFSSTCRKYYGKILD